MESEKASFYTEKSNVAEEAQVYVYIVHKIRGGGDNMRVNASATLSTEDKFRVYPRQLSPKQKRNIHIHGTGDNRLVTVRRNEGVTMHRLENSKYLHAEEHGHGLYQEQVPVVWTNVIHTPNIRMKCLARVLPLMSLGLET